VSLKADGTAPAVEQRTRYDRNMLERYHAELLGTLVYPKFLTVSFKVNFVDQRITTPKMWRDVYRHDDKGAIIGWTRRDGETTSTSPPMATPSSKRMRRAGRQAARCEVRRRSRGIESGQRRCCTKPGATRCSTTNMPATTIGAARSVKKKPWTKEVTSSRFAASA